MTRTLEESLARAQNLRDFRFTSPKAFERNNDFEDIVNLADEVIELRFLKGEATLAEMERVEAATLAAQIEDDHHESW